MAFIDQRGLVWNRRARDVQVASEDREPREALLLSLVVPTRNEVAGVPALLERLLHGMSETDPRDEEPSIIRDALSPRSTTIVRSTNMGWATNTADRVNIARHTLTLIHLDVDLRELLPAATTTNGNHATERGSDRRPCWVMGSETQKAGEPVHDMRHPSAG